MSSNKLPDFFILGAGKCGTTSLHFYLNQHPQIFLPEKKELHFFNRNQLQLPEDLQEYHAYFAKAKEGQIVGEATPAYFHQTERVIKRLKQLYTDTTPKFILLLRDPVERAWSHYQHVCRLQLRKESFEQALALEEQRKQDKDTHHPWHTYKTEGEYARQLRPWFEAFPPAQFKIFLTEDLAHNPQAVCEEIFRFLQVSPQFKLNNTRAQNTNHRHRFAGLQRWMKNPSSFTRKIVKLILPQSYRFAIAKGIAEWNTVATPLPQMNTETSEELKQYFSADVEQLEAMIQRDLSAWK